MPSPTPVPTPAGTNSRLGAVVVVATEGGLGELCRDMVRDTTVVETNGVFTFRHWRDELPC